MVRRLLVSTLTAFAAIFCHQVDSQEVGDIAIAPGIYGAMLSRSPGYLRLAIPIEPILSALRASLDEAGATNKDIFFKTKELSYLGGDLNVSHKVLAFNITVDGRIKAIGENFTCRIFPRLAFPASYLERFGPQDLGTYTECEVSGALGNLFQLNEWLRVAIGLGLGASLHDATICRAMPEPGSAEYKDCPTRKCDEYIKCKLEHDQSLAKFISRAKLQMQPSSISFFDEENPPHYRGGPAIDLRIAWPPGIYLNHEAEMIQEAPTALGAASLGDIEKDLPKLLAAAPRQPSKRYPGYSYPAKIEDDHYEDGDMALFGGLLCLVGEGEGCELVSRSQGDDGRWWRSPDKVGQTSLQGSTFSGDQFNGIVAYFLRTGDKERFEKWLAFVKNNTFNSPSNEIIYAKAKASCADTDKKICMLQGAEWYWLKSIAKMLNVNIGNLPDIVFQDEKYGDPMRVLDMRALLIPPGFQLHLVGLQLLLNAKLGAANDQWQRLYQKAAAILASRQKDNPFFLYLHLGADQRVVNAMKDKCSLDKPERRHFNQWSWERAEYVEAWKNNMIWDCVFMSRLLLGPDLSWKM